MAGMRIERRLAELGLELPQPMQLPPGLTALAILASLQRTLGDLDRVTGWLRVFGMVNSAPGFTRTPAVINGFSDLILDLWGPDAGPHARSAIGVAELPFNLPVEIEAEVAVD
jgi:enamine deaminase RidA (YjgF/YER057c/UK114 family)